MGSKGRLPPPHMRRPLPGAGLIHPDPFGPGIRPPPGAFPPFDMMPPSEVLEQKMSTQHMEMQRLATENQRLAATHVTLRQELAGAQQELQRLQVQVGTMKNEKERHMRGIMDKIAKMEVDLHAEDSVNVELQQARTEAQSLVAARQELFAKVQQLTQDIQRTHTDAQQVPALMSELEALRQEYQHCRATYDYEKKLYNDHYESLQVMEKNYVSMAREVEKLRAELANAANLERRAGPPYGGATGYKETEAAGQQSVGKNAYEDGYSVPQERGSLPGPPPAPYGGGPMGSAPPRPGYDPARGPGYDPARGPGYDTPRGLGYDAPRSSGYDATRGGSYEAPRGLGYETQPRTAAGGRQGQVPANNNGPYGSATPQGQVPANNVPYGSATSPTRAAGSGYNGQSRAGNPSMR